MDFSLDIKAKTKTSTRKYRRISSQPGGSQDFLLTTWKPIIMKRKKKTNMTTSKCKTLLIKTTLREQATAKTDIQDIKRTHKELLQLKNKKTINPILNGQKICTGTSQRKL